MNTLQLKFCDPKQIEVLRDGVQETRQRVFQSLVHGSHKWSQRVLIVRSVERKVGYRQSYFNIWCQALSYFSQAIKKEVLTEQEEFQKFVYHHAKNNHHLYNFIHPDIWDNFKVIWPCWWFWKGKKSVPVMDLPNKPDVLTGHYLIVLSQSCLAYWFIWTYW